MTRNFIQQTRGGREPARFTCIISLQETSIFHCVTTYEKLNMMVKNSMMSLAPQTLERNIWGLSMPQDMPFLLHASWRPPREVNHVIKFPDHREMGRFGPWSFRPPFKVISAPCLERVGPSEVISAHIMQSHKITQRRLQRDRHVLNIMMASVVLMLKANTVLGAAVRN